MARLSPRGEDPRLTARPIEEPVSPFQRPLVARPARRAPTGLWVTAIIGSGAAIFLWLSAQRASANAPRPPRAAGPSSAAALPEPLPTRAGGPAGPMFDVPAPQFRTDNTASEAAIAPSVLSAAPAGAAGPSILERRRAPAVVVDLGSSSTMLLAQAEAAPMVPAAAPEAPAKNPLSDDEQFAERVGGAGAERARATALRNLDALVPQGALISAVLETAVNSDLPGYTRAVVSRDVKSFDGSTVLIPRGSRLIGQYRSGVALGASRVFVIWTRVIRPDGVSVEIASPGADALGRGGLGGEVDRHFFTRFGSSILLSVLNAGVAALSNNGRGQIYIGSSVDAASVAAAAIGKDGGAPPTIRTPQGAFVKVFVARDLDFSGVRP